MTSAAPRPREAAIAALVCAALLGLFWARSQAAVAGKSSTFDEPVHALGAWVHRHFGDWRINHEDPPLWHYWAALPNGPSALRADFDAPAWRRMAGAWEEQWPWTVDTLYRTPENDGEAFVGRSRRMMIALGVALGAAIALWGWQIGGAATAVPATLLFSLDPSFLGHAALVKNDVALALCSLSLCFALWRMGRRLTPWNLAAAALACAAAMTTKFSGALLAPLFAALLLGVRALLPDPWPLGARRVARGRRRALVAAVCLLAIAAVSWAGIWAAYGFRFAAMPDASLALDRATILDQARQAQVGAARARAAAGAAPGPQSEAEVAAALREWQPDRVLRSLGWMLDRRLFPEAWLAGLIFVHARSQLRASYLDGEMSVVGFRRYFPLAMLYKTPLATLAALGAAAAIALGLALRRPTPAGAAGAWPAAWLGACLLLPAALAFALAVRSSLDIGLRHVLPAYPPLFLAAGWAFAAALARARRSALAAGALLAASLAAESLAAAPDYVAFFNAAAGGARGGLRHLGDSNLDWGQDLPLLAAWQARNPEVPLYLAYFGVADPASYGIRYRNLPGGYPFGETPSLPGEGPAVVAISATKLQCLYLGEDLAPFYRRFGRSEPAAVLGGTIYLYDLREPLRRAGPAPCGRAPAGRPPREAGAAQRLR